MKESKSSSKGQLSKGPSLDEIRRAHQAETDRINRAIRDGTVDQLQADTRIFQQNLTPEEFQAKQRKRLEADTALRVFFSICEKWKLDELQIIALLGNPDRKDYEDYRCRAVWMLPNDVLVRISFVMGIYKALREIFQTEKQGNEWPRKPNRDFQNRSALELMLDGELAKVRRYLEGH